MMSTCVLTRPMSPQHRQQGFGMCLLHPVALSNKVTLRDISGTAPLPSSSGWASLYIYIYIYIHTHKQTYYLFSPNINSNGKDKAQNILNTVPWLKKKRNNIYVSITTNQMPEGHSTSNSWNAMYTKHLSDSGKCPASYYDCTKHMKVCTSSWQINYLCQMTRDNKSGNDKVCLPLAWKTQNVIKICQNSQDQDKDQNKVSNVTLLNQVIHS